MTVEYYTDQGTWEREEERCPGSGEPKQGTRCPRCDSDLTALMALSPKSTTIPIHVRRDDQASTR